MLTSMVAGMVVGDAHVALRWCTGRPAHGADKGDVGVGADREQTVRALRIGQAVEEKTGAPQQHGGGHGAFLSGAQPHILAREASPQ